VLQEKQFEKVGDERTRLRRRARDCRDQPGSPGRRCRRAGFRSDLYFRLGVFPIEVPPLRERQEDIGFLAERFPSGVCFGTLAYQFRRSENAIFVCSRIMTGPGTCENCSM